MEYTTNTDDAWEKFVNNGFNMIDNINKTKEQKEYIIP